MTTMTTTTKMKLSLPFMSMQRRFKRYIVDGVQVQKIAIVVGKYKSAKTSISTVMHYDKFIRCCDPASSYLLQFNTVTVEKFHQTTIFRLVKMRPEYYKSPITCD